MTGIWVRPQIPGLSPGGLGPQLTSSGFPSGLSSGFPFAHPGSSPSSAVLRFPFRPAFSGSVPSAVAVRSGFPSASLRVPFPLSNAHASTPKGRFRRRWSRAVGTKVTSSRRDPWLRSARNTKCSPGADRGARRSVPAGRAHHALHVGSGDDRRPGRARSRKFSTSRPARPVRSGPRRSATWGPWSPGRASKWPGWARWPSPSTRTGSPLTRSTRSSRFRDSCW